MADRHMDFDAARAESTQKVVDPLGFTLCGTEWEIRTDIPGAMLLDFITAETVTSQLRSGKDLLLEAISPEQKASFEAMLRAGRPASVLLTADLTKLTAAELKAKAKELDVEIPTKIDKPGLVKLLNGKRDSDGASPPDMPLLDEVIAWLVRELIGRPSTP